MHGRARVREIDVGDVFVQLGDDHAPLVHHVGADSDPGALLEHVVVGTHHVGVDVLAGRGVEEEVVGRFFVMLVAGVVVNVHEALEADVVLPVGEDTAAAQLGRVPRDGAVLDQSALRVAVDGPAKAAVLRVCHVGIKGAVHHRAIPAVQVQGAARAVAGVVRKGAVLNGDGPLVDVDAAGVSGVAGNASGCRVLLERDAVDRAPLGNGYVAPHIGAGVDTAAILPARRALGAVVLDFARAV